MYEMLQNSMDWWQNLLYLIPLWQVHFIREKQNSLHDWRIKHASDEYFLYLQKALADGRE